MKRLYNKGYQIICEFILDYPPDDVEISLKSYIAKKEYSLCQIIDTQLNDELSRKNMDIPEFYYNLMDKQESIFQTFNKNFSSKSNLISMYKDDCEFIIKRNDSLKSIDLELKSTLKLHLNNFKQLNDKQAGIAYEIFCSNFLEDIGFESSITPPSKDYGIDIIAHSRINFLYPLTDTLLDNKISLIGQAKYYTSPCSEPIIRQLIGDYLFCLFEKRNITNQVNYLDFNFFATYLCIFSHSGFSKNAKEFAKNKGIILITSDNMINILCQLKNSNISKAINFLKSEDYLKL